MSRSTTLPPASAARRRRPTASASRPTNSLSTPHSNSPRASSAPLASSSPRASSSRASSSFESNRRESGREAQAPRRSTYSSARSGNLRAHSVSSAGPSISRQRPVPKMKTSPFASGGWQLSLPAKIILSFVLTLAVLAGLSFVGVLPVRTVISQKNELAAKQARLAMLAERNSELTTRIQVLQTDEEVVRLARDKFGMVPEGQTLTVLPGLRDASRVLGGDGSQSVSAAPPPVRNEQPSFFEALLRLFNFGA
jgi:cell division protein FtsB